MKHSIASAMCLAISLLLVAGCAGTGEMQQLDLPIKQPPTAPAAMEPVRIVIEPFDDRRAEKRRVGMRTHLWGGETYFNIPGGRPGDFIAQALTDRLKVRGWQDQAWNVRMGPAASMPDADIVITGEVEEFSAHAKSRVFSTVINTASKLTIHAKNQGDASKTTRSVENSQTKTVFWFNEEDVQELLAATLKDSIDRLVADTMIEGRSLRPVR